MIQLNTRKLIHQLQEKRKIVREARSTIGELIGIDRVIEIGCGYGANAAHSKGKYLGVDINRAAIREANETHKFNEFLCGDVNAITDRMKNYDTVLFSAVLHEMPDRIDVVKIVMEAGINRVFICDFDPELHGFLKLWLNTFEPVAKTWWHCDPSQMFSDRDWTVQKGRLTRSLLWWDARRKNLPATDVVKCQVLEP
jgi:SAM-dependent methyltransferase